MKSNKSLYLLIYLLSVISVAAPKDSSIFQAKLRETFVPKDEYFQISQPSLKFSKNCNFQILSKMKILESIVYVISQPIILWGHDNSPGRRRNIAKILSKVSTKFCEFKISLKPQQYLLSHIYYLMCYLICHIIC